jgi:hypothetical protein
MEKRVKTGGRQKGTPNRATAAKVKEIAESGLTPLDFMLEVMRDTSQDYAIRMDAAKSAAPYVHPKLASVEHKGDPDNPVMIQTDDLALARWLALVLTKAQPTGDK